MELCITRQQVREINRKLFANDLIYEDTDCNILEELISSIVQRYDASDTISGVPTILEIKESNLSKNTIDKIKLLSTNSVYIQVNNNIIANKSNLAIIRKLKDIGYKIIIELNKEDTIFTIAKLLADVIKINVNSIPEALRNERTELTAKLLIYGVNSSEEYLMAEAINADLYEGTYISPATPIQIEAHEHSNVNFIDVIACINKPNVDIYRISEIIKRDSLLSAQIIRLSNSAYFGGRNRINSIYDAIVRIGLCNLKRWIFLLQFSRLNEMPEELLQLSYSRALICERIVKECNKLNIDSNSAYIIGLFSTLSSLTGKPIDKQLTSLRLNKEIEDALVYRDGEGGLLLKFVIAYEEADWDRVNKYLKDIKMNKSRMNVIYLDCIEKVTELWNKLTKLGGVY